MEAQATAVIAALLIAAVLWHAKKTSENTEALVELKTLVKGLVRDHDALDESHHRLRNKMNSLTGRHSLLAQRVRALDGQEEPPYSPEAA